MSPKWIVAVAAFTAVAMFPDPSQAGGWWSFIQLPGRYLSVGETVVATDEDAFTTIAEAERAEAGTDNYYVYLLEGVDEEMVDEAMNDDYRKGWWTPPPQMMRLGEVEVVEREANLVNVQAQFEVPDVPPGRYHVMFCSDGCEEPMASVVPAAVTVSDDAALVRVARRGENKTFRLLNQRARLQERIQGLQEQIRLERDRRMSAEARVESLRDRVRALNSERASGTESSQMGWFIAGTLLLGAIAVTGAGRRRRLST